MPLSIGPLGGPFRAPVAGAYFAGDGVTNIAFSQWLGQFAGMSLVGFFVYEAFEWLSLERRRVEAEARKKAAAARS